MKIIDRSPSRRVFLASALAAGPAAALAQPTAPAAPPSLDDLMARPSLIDAALSPDGKRIAMLGDRRENGERMGLVLLFQSANLAAGPTVVPIGDCEVERVEWANNDRLLVWLLLDKDKRGREIGMRWKGAVLTEYSRRVLAMDADGGNQVQIFNNQPDELRLNRDLGAVVDYVSDDADSIVMMAVNVRRQCYALYKVNVRTGAATLMEVGGDSTYGWITQRGTPVLRLDAQRSTVSIYARAPGETEWKFYRKFRHDETAKLDGIDFLAGTPEPGILLVATTMDGEDKQSIRTFDLKTLTIGEKVASRADYDVSSCLVDRKQHLLATTCWKDRLDYVFTDTDLARHYRGICAYFANAENVRISDLSEDHRTLILRVSGPTNPGSYWLYNRDRAKLEPLGARYSRLNQAALAGMEVIPVRARDGLPLTAYLTRPIGATARRPLVIMPHGGPETRDVFDYDPLLQALAAEGWMVLQVNFRGSSGYGRAFADAGRRRWGDLMQNDIEDGLAAAIARGGVDESRIAICGMSYGGYAALMGAVKSPDRYRAAISIAGVSDLLKMLAYTRRTEGTESLDYRYWTKTIGDPMDDRVALLAASPVTQAERIKASVLLMHGELDGIVPAEQSQFMRDALQRAGKSVEHVQVAAEGHPLWTFNNNIVMTRKVLDHLRKAFA